MRLGHTKYFALDFNNEYVIFLKLDKQGGVKMLQTYEAVLEPNGHLQFLENTPPALAGTCRVLVTFTSPASTADTALCGATLSEAALTEDWSRHEEEAAWAHLQADK